MEKGRDGIKRRAIASTEENAPVSLGQGAQPEVSRAPHLRTGSHKRLDALRLSYIHELPKLLADSEQLWKQICQAPGDTKECHQLHQNIQQVIGLGLTCSLHALVKVASQIAKNLTQFYKEPTHTVSEMLELQFKQIRDSIDNLELESPVEEIKSPILQDALPDRYRGIVLVIDDDPDLLNIMDFYLTSNGLQCKTVKSGEEGFLWLQHNTPDLIVLDMNMPGMNGFAVYERLRQVPETSDIPVIFLTANKDETQMLWAFDYGADDYITKPFNPIILIAKLKQVLQRKFQQEVFMKGELQPGLVLKGKYEIVSELARGGMGIVYLVVDLVTDQLLALKSLSLLQSKEDKTTARFEREISMMFKLRHPHLVRVYDADVSKGIPYYVMDYLPGSSLLHRLYHTGPMPPSSALLITAFIADALQHSHDHQILHRDIKASNIIFDAQGRAVLTDFGLALDKAEQGQRLTKAGCVTGTPCYMSPEQLQPKLILDGRSDIFSLGLVLYEMLIGHNPLARMEPMEAMTRILSSQVEPPTMHQPDIPPEVEAICLKALAYNKDDRYANGVEFSQACIQAIPWK